MKKILFLITLTLWAPPKWINQSSNLSTINGKMVLRGIAVAKTKKQSELKLRQEIKYLAQNYIKTLYGFYRPETKKHSLKIFFKRYADVQLIKQKLHFPKIKIIKKWVNPKTKQYYTLLDIELKQLNQMIKHDHKITSELIETLDRFVRCSYHQTIKNLTIKKDNKPTLKSIPRPPWSYQMGNFQNENGTQMLRAVGIAQNTGNKGLTRQNSVKQSRKALSRLIMKYFLVCLRSAYIKSLHTGSLAHPALDHDLARITEEIDLAILENHKALKLKIIDSWNDPKTKNVYTLIELDPIDFAQWIKKLPRISKIFIETIDSHIDRAHQQFSKKVAIINQNRQHK